MFKPTLITALLVLASGSAFSQISTLSNEAKAKVARGQINLNSLLSNQSNDLIVEYYVDGQNTDISPELRNKYSQAKSRTRDRLKNLTGLQLMRDYNGLPFNFYRVSNQKTLVSLLNDPQVKAVYPNRVLTQSTAQTLKFINQPAVYSNGHTGQGSTVVVVDTGVDYTHADLGKCIKPGTGTNCKVSHSIDIAKDDKKLDDIGHGTNVSAIVAAVAPQAKIVSLDVFTKNWLGKSSATDSDLVSAANWAVNNAKALNIKSINFSLGHAGTRNETNCSGALLTPFNNLRAANVIPVVSSGNDGFS